MNDLYFINQLTDALIDDCIHSKNYSQKIIITDSNIKPLYASHLPHDAVITVAAGESSKTREVKADIEDQLLALGCAKDTLIIALGGGVVSDLAGFIAATYYRGIDIIYFPTSLLAMVDASIGGKTAVNTTAGKNTIGVIRQPNAIFIWPEFLNTLPQAEFDSALFEVIKHAIIQDSDYFKFIKINKTDIFNQNKVVLNQMIRRSIDIKTNIIQQDLHEQHLREVLNFGHTMGHALESVCHYQVPHGIAVGIGMLVEAHIALQKGLLCTQDFNAIQELLIEFNLPLSSKHLTEITAQDIITACGHDKKVRSNSIRCVLPISIGQAHKDNNQYAHPIHATEIKLALHTLLTLNLNHKDHNNHAHSRN